MPRSAAVEGVERCTDGRAARLEGRPAGCLEGVQLCNEAPPALALQRSELQTVKLAGQPSHLIT
eukprot:5729323-Alexandrium_andersonii.AAC.1